MKVQPITGIYGTDNPHIPLDAKRGFRAIDSPVVDGSEVRTRRLAHEQQERVVIGYDRFGRIVYGTNNFVSPFNVRDSKESEPISTASPQAHN